MIKQLYSIYDTKTETYGIPVAYSKDGEALRAFMDLIDQGDSIYSKHPEDFALVYIGQYNMDKGELMLIESKKFLGYGNDLGSEARQQDMLGGTEAKKNPMIAEKH